MAKMRNKSKSLVTAMLAVSFVGSLSPAHADDSEIQSEEKRLKQFVADFGSTDSNYPRQLANLASTYLRNGKPKQAEQIFDNALSAARKNLRNPDLEIPNMVLYFASDLARTDFEKAQKLLDIGMRSADNLGFGDKARIDFIYGTIGFYKTFGKTAQVQAQIKSLDEQLTAIERGKSVPAGTLRTTAESLKAMADFYCLPPPISHLMPQPREMEVVKNSQTLKKNQVSLQNFKKAEDYQLRAIVQYDKLSLSEKVEGHRALALWYRYYGQKQPEQMQTEILSKLLKSNRPEILFPQRPPCIACGMG